MKRKNGVGGFDKIYVSSIQMIQSMLSSSRLSPNKKENSIIQPDNNINGNVESHDNINDIIRQITLDGKKMLSSCKTIISMLPSTEMITLMMSSSQMMTLIRKESIIIQPDDNTKWSGQCYHTARS